MPKPTLQNRDAFKSYLRAHKNKFTSRVQDCLVNDINSILTQKAAGITTSQSVKLLIFDINERIGITSEISNKNLIYIPALPNDVIRLGIGSATYSFNFGADDTGIIYSGITYGLNSTITLANSKLKVVGLGGVLLQPLDPPSFSVGVSTTTINEGGTVNFIVNTVDVGSGTTLYYNTTGTVSASDFTNNSLIGSFNIVGVGSTTGIATITRTIASDVNTEGNETFQLVISVGSTTGTVVATSSTITVVDLPPSFSVGVSTTTINEGGTVNFIVNTTNVSAGTTLYYSTDGTVSANDFTNNSLTGSFSIVGVGSTVGIATISRILSNEGGTEGTEYFTLSIRTGSTSGTVVATSSSVAVLNVEPSYNIGVSTTTINEGGTVNFTINTTDVGAGTSLYYSSSGTVSAADFTDNSLTGSFNIVGTGVTTGIATITRTIATDVFSDNAETFQLIVRTGSISGTIVATSSTVTINDVTPTYTVGVSTTIVNEGSSVTFTVTTTNLPNNTNLYYSTIGSGITASDFTNNSLTGSFAINNNSGSFSRTISGDRTTEGAEQFQIEIRTLSTSGSIVATSSTITINDTSRTPGADPSGKTFGPVQVNRDNGSTASTSDWYTICGIASLPAGSSIALFIDNSGSMTTATVQASYNLLLSKLAERNISIITVENGNEDWITPFLTELS